MSKANQAKTADTKDTKATVTKVPQEKPLPETAVSDPQPLLQKKHLSLQDAQTLQRTIGNQALRRLAIQRKMTVGPVGDKYEQEADTVAKQVVGKLNHVTASGISQRQEEEEDVQMKPLQSISTLQRHEEEDVQAKSLMQRQEEEEEVQAKSLVQRQEEEEEVQAKSLVQRQEEEEEVQAKSLVQRQEEEEEVQAKSLVQRQEEEEEVQAKKDPMLQGGELSGDVETAVTQAKSGGSPMPDNVRQPMENAFNADFSSVKIHTGSQSDNLNRSLSARAFTSGQDIFFRGGEYNPGSANGQELLAHELTHTIQQGSTIQRKHTGKRPLVNHTAPISAQTKPQIQRYLLTPQQLKQKAGEPKSDRLFVSMSAKYKDILGKLEEYHEYIEANDVDQQDFNTQKQALHTILDDLKSKCLTYIQAHKEDLDTTRYQEITDLYNKISTEKRAINIIGNNLGPVDGRRWSNVLRSEGDFGDIGGLEVPSDAAIIDKEPGLEGKFKRDTDIYESATLTGTVAGQAGKDNLAFWRPVPNQNDLLHVQHYEVTGDEVKSSNITIKATGFVPAGRIKKGGFSHKKVKNDVPIFNGPPKVDDIQQGSIGDCYLVAAIASIVNSNPDFIYNMIRDNGNGTVTVRLYDNDDPPQPEFYKLDKSVGTGNRHSEGALWVVFLEKAYASMKGSYANTIGGHSDESMQILTGKTAGRNKISTGGGTLTETSESNFWTRAPILKYTMKYKKDKAKYLDSFKTSQAYMITKDIAQAEALMEWANTHQNDIGQELQAAHESGNLEDFEPILPKINDLDLTIKTKFVNGIKAKYAGIMGSGRYTETQEALFTRIETALAAKKYVGASTDKVPGVESGKGKSAGESKVEGLVSTHAYTVLDTSTTEDGLHYIKLRNPWGSYGRQYKGKDEATGALKVETDPENLAETTGLFDIELTDFTRCYDEIHIGNRD